ncbi:MAG TPA: hypothetical protein VIT66_06300, partial [Lysobacter sp.]
EEGRPQEGREEGGCRRNAGYPGADDLKKESPDCRNTALSPRPGGGRAFFLRISPVRTPTFTGTAHASGT